MFITVNFTLKLRLWLNVKKCPSLGFNKPVMKTMIWDWYSIHILEVYEESTSAYTVGPSHLQTKNWLVWFHFDKIHRPVHHSLNNIQTSATFLCKIKNTNVLSDLQLIKIKYAVSKFMEVWQTFLQRLV